ncbi:MAG: TonB-dependent receptor [Betaproteobacteria bacterium]|nr:TonB-dependent receptor [Betaproteobacteria bacterium]
MAIHRPLTLAAAFQAAAVSVSVHAQAAPDAVGLDAPVRHLGVVTVTGGQPTSLPTQIPATMEGIAREQIEQSINATDSEDALKYFPSLLVRKRYIGDYNHAILSSRASGTGNSARSLVYADGILLSNLLGNGVGGLGFPPRWGMVTPEEIERVDVMYGPFSAAYPGNSVGAVVDYVTRMPREFEAHVKVGFVNQAFSLYNTNQTFRAWQTSASMGSRAGDWSWFVNFNRTESEGQPLTFATRLASTGAAGGAGVPVTGAVLDRNNANQPWYILGTGTQYTTVQDHAKLKLAYDVSSTLRAAYTLGLWQNRSDGQSASYLRNPQGQPVYSGPVSIGGRTYAALTGGDFALTRESLMHALHGLSVKTRTQGEFDWEIATSVYDYQRDVKRQNAASNTLPAAAFGGSGTLADGSGSGWYSLAFKGTWRPKFAADTIGQHVVDFGWQQDQYQLRYITWNITSHWLADTTGALASQVGGRTALRSLYAQDTWAFAPRWKTVLGVRLENWRAFDGLTAFSASSSLAHPSRNENFTSPKAALSWQWSDDTVLKAAVGRAVRMPTVAELYGATSTTNSRFINDPNLKPERSVTTEFSVERDAGTGLWRATVFAENTRDALYSQTAFDPAANLNISRVQNVDRIASTGLEVVYSGSEVGTAWGVRGLDAQASLTYANSIIKANNGFVVVPGDTLGRAQPNIPRWRASALASYRFHPQWIGTVAARYSGPQFRTLNNADVNGFAYQGASKFFVVDLRARWQIDQRLSAAFGIDNANRQKYWNFHPYPQRSYVAELKADL